MDTRTLARAGELLIGEEWQRPLARVLGPRHPQGRRETIDPRLVQRWASGERPVPSWVPPVLSEMLLKRVDEFQSQAREAKSLARGISHLARSGPLAEGPPDDLAPLGGPDDYRPDDDDPAP